MPSEYNHITAFHYSAYRPSLHQRILEECSDKTKNYTLGLDVGCGTGQSSIALANFCNKVIGIEPSEEMLQKSIEHNNVEYRYYNKKRFDFSDDYFDIITFAGSLYYAKSQALLDEVARVSKCGSSIIIYDFEILIDDILEKLILKNVSKPELLYNHEINFEGLNEKCFKIEKQFKNHVKIEISSSNLAHLLLSSKDNYYLLLKSLGSENLHSKLDQKLLSTFQLENILVDTNTYATVYRNMK